jgi:two-component system response regulator AtoC
LRNVIMKASVVARSPEIAPSDLPLGFSLRPKSNGPVPIDQGGAQIFDRAPSLDRMEKHAILDTLSKTNGHQQRAAEMLGISRRTLSRKLKLYGLEDGRQNIAQVS